MADYLNSIYRMFYAPENGNAEKLAPKLRQVLERRLLCIGVALAAGVPDARAPAVEHVLARPSASTSQPRLHIPTNQLSCDSLTRKHPSMVCRPRLHQHAHMAL